MAAIRRNNTGFDDASSQFGGSASCRNSSTDICPYCRSYRGEFKERSVDANFSTCVQPSSTCSNISVAAYHNCGTDRRELSSLNAHPFHCYPLVRISSSANSTTNSQSPQQNGIWLRSSVHNFNHICRCTKSISSSRASNLQGATFNSPIDGNFYKLYYSIIQLTNSLHLYNIEYYWLPVVSCAKPIVHPVYLDNNLQEFYILLEFVMQKKSMIHRSWMTVQSSH